jgi:hypothetical protein
MSQYFDSQQRWCNTSKLGPIKAFVHFSITKRSKFKGGFKGGLKKTILKNSLITVSYGIYWSGRRESNPHLQFGKLKRKTG